MSVCEKSVDVHATPEAVFDLIHDYERRLSWDPFLKEARLLDGACAAGIGVAARCVAKNRLGAVGMETVYVSFRRPEVAAVKMTRGPRILASFAATLRHRQLAPGITRVDYRFSLQARPRWLRPLLNPILRWIFSRETQRRLQALKRALEPSP